MPDKSKKKTKNTSNKNKIPSSRKPKNEVSLNDIMEMMVNQNKAILAIAEGNHKKDAVNNPTLIRQAYETEEHVTGNIEDRVMESTGPAEISLAPPSFKEVGRDGQHYSDDKLKMLSFMEDMLLVEINDTTDVTQVMHVPVWNDGKVQYFIRNKPQKVKRKYVEVLARAKKTTYTQYDGFNLVGDKAIFNRAHTVLQYPFRVLEDPAGISKGTKGFQWMKRIQEEQ